jgi:tetrapyrrole methylase family protein/MazG family protein
MSSFARLRKIVATLRGPEGCPWDMVQTHESLRPYLLEETHETLAALDEGSAEKLSEELGDLLLEVLLHVQIAEEQGDFTLDDVIYSISDKLVRRHPHVFATATAETPEAVIEQWDRLKAEERGDTSALEGIPATLPALAQAQAFQRRASRAGFKFEAVEEVWEALEEELRELREATTQEERSEEAGDALFALVNLVRWYEADAEDSLRNTCRGFSRIFQDMERIVRTRGVDMEGADVKAKMEIWEEAKGLSKAAPETQI